MSTKDSTLANDLTDIPDEPTEEELAPQKRQRPAREKPVETLDEAAEYDEEEEVEEEIAPSRLRGMLVGSGACVFSMLFHLVGLVVLGLLVFSTQIKQEVNTIVASVFEERPEDEPVEIELEQDLEAVTEQSAAVFSSAPTAATMGAVGGSATAAPQLDQKVMEESTEVTISVGPPSLGMPTMAKAIEAVPDGALGDSRAIVDNYDEAMDRITQELVWMLDKGDVLVVWCFDQSESMKDDQQEIKDRINKVYQELGLSDRTSGDHLTTSIISYGAGFAVHTQNGPTSNRVEIRDAIDAVPVDPSGKEMMCEAVGLAIRGHREYVKKTQRQMALVLVTDESGDRPNNEAFLEKAIFEAKSAKCRIYTLGREAVFGYPYVYMRWQHPQTNRWHWLPVDRGPETAFVEQLQTNGFHRRYDAFSSGFGPYEQARLARESHGIFFMLPSVESKLVRGNADKRRYDLELMRPYRPDLRAREQVIADRVKYPLRSLIWKVINDLNPYVNKNVIIQTEFSIDPATYRRQMLSQQAKAIQYLRYLAEAQAYMEKGRLHREQEADPRWQANYDLIYAQIVSYQARIYEYGMTLEVFLRSPQTAPAMKPPNLRHVQWDIRTHKSTLTEEAKPFIEKADALFNVVIENHPGTPWAERAKAEMARGYGCEFIPDYDPPYVNVSNPSPVPKL